MNRMFRDMHDAYGRVLDRLLESRKGKGVDPYGEEVINVRFFTDYNICNYSCPYCIAGQANKDEIVDEWDSTNYDTIIENLAKLPRRLNVRIGVGGEFFVSKKLVAGARRLSNADNVQSLNLITNLSLSEVQYRRHFQGFDTDKLAIVASYHPTEIKDHDKWLATASFVKEKFDFAVILVAYPPALAKLRRIRRELNSLGFVVFVQGYIGQYMGLSYPQSYTSKDRELLREVCYSRHDYEFFIEAKKPGLCNSGYKSFYVNMTGKVVPCGMVNGYEPLGDLSKSPHVKLNDGPQMCRSETCFCDTENMNTVVFEQNYYRSSKNQHVYEYRDEEKALADPSLGEWVKDYEDVV